MKYLMIFLLAVSCLLCACRCPYFLQNRAQRMSKTYPEIKAICDSVGSCWNVKIMCTRYDGSGNSLLRNKTFWSITTENPYVGGYSIQDNAHIDTPSAIREAASNYWNIKKMRDEENVDDNRTIYPNSTDCSNNCEGK